MMRPPTEILDNFYLLAEYDSEKRIEAIDSIINHSVCFFSHFYVIIKFKNYLGNSKT